MTMAACLSDPLLDSNRSAEQQDGGGGGGGGSGGDQRSGGNDNNVNCEVGGSGSSNIVDRRDVVRGDFVGSSSSNSNSSSSSNIGVNDDENEEEYGEFCDQFDFVNSSTCWICNGFYAPSFGEPLCGTCHSFLFSSPSFDVVKEQVTILSDDEDSGNDEPPYNATDKERAEPEEEMEQEFELEVPDVSENELEDNEFELVRPAPAPPRNINQYIDLLSKPYEGGNNINDNSIEALPVEVLLSIFSYLDDISLWNVSEVCKRWRKILDVHTSQTMWEKYTIERWPLYRILVNIPNWFHLYGALLSSCFCRTCFLQMALRTPLQGRINNFRSTRLRGDIRTLDVDATDGIDAVPLDSQLSHWQATILGPAGSPYEGGKFFLYIVIPFQYPMCPPTVRFLTKIVHPNVSRHGDVGVDIIQHNWSLALTISKLLLSVQSLLTDPFTDICMEPELGRLYAEERPKFRALARRWTEKYAMLEVLTPS